jgi:hypothetical protein
MRYAFRQWNHRYNRHFRPLFLGTACAPRLISLTTSESDSGDNVASALLEHMALALKQPFEQARIGVLGAFAAEEGRFPPGEGS